MRETDPADENEPVEEIEIAERLLDEMRQAGRADAGEEQLEKLLHGYEDDAGRPVAAILGGDQVALGAGFGDLRNPRAFLKATVCRKGDVRLSVKLAIKAGIPSLVGVIGGLVGGIGAVPAGLVGAVAALLAYEGVEKVCQHESVQ